MWFYGGILWALVLTTACAGAPREEPEPWTDAWLELRLDEYLEDDELRRRALMESLENPDNSYSRTRLDAYGLVDRGWDTLPVWNPRSAPVTDEVIMQLQAGALSAPEEELWDGQRPQTTEAWVELGRRVFLGYPLRAEPLVEWVLAEPERGLEFGIVEAPDGTYPGTRVIVDSDGITRLGITCALCHAAVVNDALIVGFARRGFDIGALWLARDAALGRETDADLATRLAVWGPGRADISEDPDEDPVAIPDLWGLQHQVALTQAGTIRHHGPIALAIRQETQLLHSNHQRIRPPRELTWALAMFLYSLEPPAAMDPPSGHVARGRAVFQQHCANCHSNDAYGGDLVPTTQVGTDPTLANGSGRGTGFYRTPALLGVAMAGPYLHHGAVPTLEDMFDRIRFDVTYEGSLGLGAVAGHPFGTELEDGDTEALLSFLRTL